MEFYEEIKYMSSKSKILAVVPAMVLGVGLAIPAFAQDAVQPALRCVRQVTTPKEL